jgi:hypothetical protein
MMMKLLLIRSVASALLMAGSLTVLAQTPQPSSPAAPETAPAPKPMPSPEDLEPAVDTSATAPSERTAPAQSSSKSDTPAPSAAAAPPPSAPTSPGSITPAPGAGAKSVPVHGGRAMDRLDLETTEITGNRELPKVLYIVPWKRSDLGDLIGKPVNSLLDEVLEPVDRDVFRRENRYYRALAPDSAQAPDPAAPK